MRFRVLRPYSSGDTLSEAYNIRPFQGRHPQHHRHHPTTFGPSRAVTHNIDGTRQPRSRRRHHHPGPSRAATHGTTIVEACLGETECCYPPTKQSRQGCGRGPRHTPHTYTQPRMGLHTHRPGAEMWRWNPSRVRDEGRWDSGSSDRTPPEILCRRLTTFGPSRAVTFSITIVEERWRCTHPYPKEKSVGAMECRRSRSRWMSSWRSWRSCGCLSRRDSMLLTPVKKSR